MKPRITSEEASSLYEKFTGTKCKFNDISCVQFDMAKEEHKEAALVIYFKNYLIY